MARLKKPMKVDEYRNSSLGVVVDIMLDRNRMIFTATFADQEVEHATAEGCKAAVEEIIRASLKLEWRQIIIVDRRTRSWGASHNFHAHRHEVADSKDETVEREFRTEPDDPQPNTWMESDSFRENIDNPLYGVHKCNHSTKTGTYEVVIPYSKEAWRTVLAINEALKLVDKKINELIESPDIEALLVTGNLRTLALPAPRGEEEKEE